MSLSNKQLLLSPVKSNTVTKSLSNKLVSLPPETYSSTSTSPNYGISSDASRELFKNRSSVNSQAK